MWRSSGKSCWTGGRDDPGRRDARWGEESPALNDALAFLDLDMKAAGFLEFGTDLHNPDLAKMAEAAGLLG